MNAKFKWWQIAVGLLIAAAIIGDEIFTGLVLSVILAPVAAWLVKEAGERA